MVIEEMNSLTKDEDFDELKNKYQEITSVLAAHQIALWEYDIPTGQCSFTDDYFRILGLREAGIVFENIDDFYQYAHSEDIVPYRNAFSQMLESEDKISQIQVRCMGCHGEIIWLEDHFLSYQKNEAGHPEKIIAYTINVTSQCEKESHIRRLEERNRKIIEALPEFIFIFDNNFFITDVLMAPDTVLLHPVDVLKGADGRSIYSPEVSDLFIRNINECLKDGEMKEIEYPLDVENGRYYFQARIAPFEGNNVLALIHDIGERVQHAKELIEAKRKAEEADRMKSVFLANMSHEIRTPLNAIVGFSDVIGSTYDELSEEERADFVRLISINSEHLVRLIDDVLDLSKIESNTIKFTFTDCSLQSLMMDIEKEQAMKPISEIEIRASFPNEDVYINTDATRLKQVVCNFINNARKFTEKGYIHFGYAVDPVNADFVNIFVEDTGSGIPQECQKDIFDRFYKVDTFKQGTGLGLSICKTIVEHLQGDISVESEMGRGSRFTVILPFERQAVN